jgi:hypothetical protein
MSQHNWLPSLIYRSGQTDLVYLKELNSYYQKDFYEDKIMYGGNPIAVKKHPIVNGCEATLWHLITGNAHLPSEPILEYRSEKFSWIKSVLTKFDTEHSVDILHWENMRKGEKRFLHYIIPERYLIVLTERRGYNLFWTAYPIMYNHEHRKLMKEHQEFIS